MNYRYDSNAGLEYIMDLKALRYFVEVVRQKSFTRAAELLHVTQPTLSKMIRQLEEEMQSSLLVRGSRGVWPTDIGQTLYRHGSQILDQVRSVKDEIDEIKGMVRGSLRLGLAPMLSAPLFPCILRMFRERYPNISLTFIEAGSKRMAQAISNGEVELGLIVEPVDLELFEARPILSDQLVLVAPVSSPWAGRDFVAPEELAEENFLMPTEDFLLPHMIRTYFRDAGFTPKEVGHSSQWQILQIMVETGMGVAVVPRVICRLFDPAKIAMVRLKDPPPTIHLCVAWRRGGYPSFAARAWTDISIEALKAHL